jgi:hypothetical protein
MRDSKQESRYERDRCPNDLRRIVFTTARNKVLEGTHPSYKMTLQKKSFKATRSTAESDDPLLVAKQADLSFSRISDERAEGSALLSRRQRRPASMDPLAPPSTYRAVETLLISSLFCGEKRHKDSAKLPYLG